MKKVILMMAFAIGITGAYAQKTVKVEKVEIIRKKWLIPVKRKPRRYWMKRM